MCPLAFEVTPEVSRDFYRSYPHRLVWAGWNASTRVSASNLLLREPGDFASLPSTTTPIVMKEIDAFAFAFLYIQWLAYGKSSTYPLSEEWPPRVRELEIHCNRYVDELPDLHAAVNYILQYLPSEWRETDGCYIPYLKRSTIVMWDAALKSGGFISQEFEVQLKWYHALNYYAVENSLLCKFIIQGVMTQRKRLIFQAQGRLKTTRYKDCSKRRRCEDRVLREECMLA